MSQTERLYKISHLLSQGQCLSRQRLLDDLEISLATLKRDLAYLRDRMNMPVVFDREQLGYRVQKNQVAIGTQYELPGLWFSSEEIHALLTMQHLLSQLDTGGLLGPHIEPLSARLGTLLGSGTIAKAELIRRIRIQTVGARRVHLPHFQAIGSALLRRQRLSIEYHGRSSDVSLKREVSPQRLIHYRDNWYMDAWCLLRRALRSFSIDSVKRVQVLDRSAIEVPENELNKVLGAGYGIFAGKKVQWATLRFTPERARWVAAESWHPLQRGHWDATGHWVLQLPYSDPRELVMDVMRHVPEVEVIEPEGLRQIVLNKLTAGIKQLRAGSSCEPGIEDH